MTCINKSNKNYKLAKARYGESFAESVIRNISKSKGLIDDFYYPTIQEIKDYYKGEINKKETLIFDALKNNANLSLKTITDLLQGIIHKHKDIYFVTQGFGNNQSFIIRADNYTMIYRPNLEIIKKLEEMYPDIFSRTYVVKYTPPGASSKLNFVVENLNLKGRERIFDDYDNEVFKTPSKERNTILKIARIYRDIPLNIDRPFVTRLTINPKLILTPVKEETVETEESLLNENLRTLGFRERQTEIIQKEGQFISSTGNVYSSLEEALYYNEVKEGVDELFSKDLAQKIQDKLQRLYPEIKLNITNNPIWEQGDNIFNQEEFNNQVQYRLKIVEALINLSTPKIDKRTRKYGEINEPVRLTFRLNTKERPNLETNIRKQLRGKGVTDNQIDFVFDYMKSNNINEISTEELIIQMLANYSYTVEINTAKENKETPYTLYKKVNNKYIVYNVADEQLDSFDNKEDAINKVKEYNYLNTKHYSNLTVPGGTNYTENRIDVPKIIAAIKAHAQFALDYTIGWFRSDDKIDTKTGTKIITEYRIGTTEDVIAGLIEPEEVGKDVKIVKNNDLGTTDSKTRRILEVQSDWTQKLRLNFIHNGIRHKIVEINATEKQHWIGDKIVSAKEYQKAFEDFVDNGVLIKNGTKEQNDFARLIFKNWETFFIKSIIQDSAKKGYEKVLFPVGDTAAKIEGHDTVEEFIRNKKSLLERNNKRLSSYTVQPFKNGFKVYVGSVPQFDIFKTEEEAKEKIKIMSKDDIIENQQLEKQIEDAKAGKLKISSIANFYETTIFNILKKQGYNPNRITDEYGNGWYEIGINQARDLQNLLLQRNEANQIIGQANIKAMTVLIDAVNQKQDTLPHEYAHHYIAWFRNTPIVQEAIKKWGSEEALVQSIGEQVIKQKGEAYNWWNKFVKWIMNQFNSLSNIDKQELTNILTDAFLTRQDLSTIGQIKPGVDNLFQDQSLANQVYEALGFVPKMITREGQEYFNNPRIRFFVKIADEVRASLPNVKEGYTRLYRGNRPSDLKSNPQFTNSLEGIALPFLMSYEGQLSYIDIPTNDLSKYVQKGGVATNAEFIVTPNIAKSAIPIDNSIVDKYKKQYPDKLVPIEITPQQEQQAKQLYSQYLDSLNKPNTNPVLTNKKSIDNPVYSAVFFDTNEVVSKYKQVHPNLYSHHSTIEFKPSDISNLPIGENKNIKIIGRLTTAKVDVLIVENPLSKNKFPHITLSTAEGVKPFESNSEIEKNQDKIKPITDSIQGVVGVFDGKNEITSANPQQEQVKKFAELQERLNNKEFIEGAKNAYESTPALQQYGTQAEYNDYIARVSLGIIKNPSSGEYNYTSKVKDINESNLLLDVYNNTDISNAEKDDYKIVINDNLYLDNSESKDSYFGYWMPIIYNGNDIGRVRFEEKINKINGTTVKTFNPNIQIYDARMQEGKVDHTKKGIGTKVHIALYKYVKSIYPNRPFVSDVQNTIAEIGLLKSLERKGAVTQINPIGKLSEKYNNYTTDEAPFIFNDEYFKKQTSKQDIEGFKKFVNKPSPQPAGVVKSGVNELFTSNPELASVGTAQQYSQYLDSIFPDSKVKDIVYHGSNKRIEKLSLEETRKSQLAKFPDLPTVDAFFLTPSKLTAQVMTSDKAVINSAIINSKNPLEVTTSLVKQNNISTLAGTILFTNSPEMISKYRKLGYDSFDSSANAANEYVVFEPEQIHILGSKQDIEGFKEFVNNKKDIFNLINTIDPIQSVINKINSNFTEEDLKNQLNSCKI